MIENMSHLLLYVSNLEASVSFYKRLNFTIKVVNDKVQVAQLGDFALHLVSNEGARDDFRKDAYGEPKGTGLYIFVKVTDIDSLYQQVLDLKPSGEPKDWPWGNREFVLRDPDGYKLVFYQKVQS